MQEKKVLFFDHCKFRQAVALAHESNAFQSVDHCHEKQLFVF